MIKIILTPEEQTININSIRSDAAIFAKKNGKLVGMVVWRNNDYAIVMHTFMGDAHVDCKGSSYSETIRLGIKKGYEFFIEA